MVSILVLMELGLERAQAHGSMRALFTCFYPCFNGIRVGTCGRRFPLAMHYIGFYPCFNGIRVGTQNKANKSL